MSCVWCLVCDFSFHFVPVGWLPRSGCCCRTNASSLVWRMQAGGLWGSLLWAASCAVDWVHRNSWRHPMCRIWFLCLYLSWALILLSSESELDGSLPGSPPSLVVVSWLRDIMFVVFLPSRCLCLGFQCLPGVVLCVFSLSLSSALMFSV